MAGFFLDSGYPANSWPHVCKVIALLKGEHQFFMRFSVGKYSQRCSVS